ncbi:hypothetical protein TIFTF001_007692 [Ficus carica]|uniref:Uncharacterized protein n=1 Tax=Ficus carica TaxID=3494 RepID=A0AA87ZQT0_FICCA|nr:hypothetical protein TIFTF001_007692 [Ficus carica]
MEGKIKRVGLRENQFNWVLLLGIFKKRNNSSATAGGERSVKCGRRVIAFTERSGRGVIQARHPVDQHHPLHERVDKNHPVVVVAAAAVV